VKMHKYLSELPYAPYCSTANRAALQFVRVMIRPIRLLGLHDGAS
jgi:hypothetical protein